MPVCAYLDDYDLIRIEGVNPDFSGEFKVDESGKEVIAVQSRKEDIVELLLSEKISLENKISVSAQGMRFPVQYRLVTHTEQFEEEWIPDVTTLGTFYTEEKTIFRFWAPFSDRTELVLNGDLFSMEKKEKGVYEITLAGDYEKAEYHFIVTRDENRSFFLDPFAFVKSFNDIDSIVIDPNKINKEKTVMEPVDVPVIYECSVRDFSSYPGLFEHPGKIVAFKQESLRYEGESVGLDYLKSLGISHIQLMPILDYDNDHGSYNWGYNPINYNYFKDEYLISDDPYEKIKEVRSTFETLHRNNIRVILDVVFNHVYSTESFILNRILPYYFYRMEGTELANGAGLGNELRTESRFMRDYLKLLMNRLVEYYDIDGLRYDLSGLVDIETIRQIDEAAKIQKPDFLTICEGWKMGECLKDNACDLEHSEKISDALFFSPFLRDVIRGNDDTPGIIFGNMKNREEFKKAFVGENEYLDVSQTLNYAECHDNATVYDWCMRKGNGQTFEHIARTSFFALSLTVLARGIPFIQSGQEFLRSKNGIDNTYNAPDEINQLDYRRRKCYWDRVESFKDLIRVRKRINDYYTKEYSYTDYYEVIVLNIEDLKILVNPCPFHHIYTDGNRYETLFDGKERTSIIDDGINIEPYTVVVAKIKL